MEWPSLSAHMPAGDRGPVVLELTKTGLEMRRINGYALVKVHSLKRRSECTPDVLRGLDCRTGY